MKRFLATMMALAMTMTLFAGCSQGQPSQTQSSSPAQTSSQPQASTASQPASQASAAASQSSASSQPASAPAAYPMTITDQLGNSVTLEAPVEKIVSGYYISSSTCIALGLKDKLVGTEEKIEARPIYKLAAPELIGKAANVGSAKAFDLEACIAAKPDLVILPKKAKDYAATLAEMKIPSIVVNPESHEQLTEMIELIGTATGTTAEAQKLVARYETILAKLAELGKGLTDANKPKVYMCNTSTYLSTAPKDMYQASVIRSAGGINAADSLEGDSWTDVSYEQILAMNPDVIIIPTNNMANGQPDYSAKEVLADTNLAGITAVKNGAVYNMPAGLEAWDSPVPSGVLGMLWMFSILHPDLYSMDSFVQDATDFYSSVYGFQMDASIVKGK